MEEVRRILKNQQFSQCPQTIVKLTGKITMVRMVRVQESPDGPFVSKPARRICGSTQCLNNEVLSYEFCGLNQVVFTFEDSKVVLNLAVSQRNEGIRMHFQTRGSRFVDDVFLPFCNATIVLNEEHNKKVHVIADRPERAVPSIVGFLERQNIKSSQKNKDTKVKSSQKNKETKTAARKKKASGTTA